MRREVLRYNRMVKNYNRYLRKLRRLRQGQSRYQREDILLKRLKALYKRMVEIRDAFRLAAAGAAVAGAMVLTPQVAQGQSFTMQTDVPTRYASIEDNAKPAFADVDGDGDMDLFIGGNSETATGVIYNDVIYFENENGVFRSADSPFPDSLNIDPVLADTARVAPAFMDYDGDGDPDAFIGLRDSTILYYENVDGSMVGVVGDGNPFNGVKLAAGSCAPTFFDVDGDGDMDAVIGKEDGNIAYFRNDDGAFVELSGADNPFDAFNVSDNAAPAFADLDGDGDMDLFIGNKEGVIAYFENEGGVWTPNQDNNPLAGISVGSEDASPAFADLDDDGDMDLWLGEADPGLLSYYENDGGVFTYVNDNTIGITRLAFDPDPGSVDADGDGDLDVFLGMGDGFVEYFRNDDGMYVYQDSANNPLNSGVFTTSFFAAPTFADLDNDGDMDCIMGTYDENIVYLENDGGVFTRNDDANPFAGLDGGDNESIAFIDLDGDGDLDALIGNKDGNVLYFRNDGTESAPMFVEAAADNPFDGIDFTNDIQPNFVTRVTAGDVDNDGDTDVLVGQSNGIVRAFFNDGSTLTEDDSRNPFAGDDFGRGGAPDLGDVDGDGDVDAIISMALGATYYFENTGTSSAVDPVLTQQVNVYPNPTSGDLQIEIPWLEGEAVLEAFDASGKLVSSRITSSRNERLDLGQMPSGLYLVRISSQAGVALKSVIKE